jgi:hypothetical protein
MKFWKVQRCRRLEFGGGITKGEFIEDFSKKGIGYTEWIIFVGDEDSHETVAPGVCMADVACD